MKSNRYVRMAAFSVLATVASCGGGGGSGGSSSPIGPVVGPQEAASPQISWYSAAQPLVQRYCVACHIDGGPAPFPLETYEQVYGKRSALSFVLEGGTMPPVGFAGLKPAETRLLLQWLADGAPQGDASQAPYKQIDSSFTYHGDTRAIIEKNCVNCHVDGGVAPFPLDSYDKVKSVAAAAAFAVEKGTMPPWPPTKGYSRFTHERALSAVDEFVLTNWLASDLAEGNPADYVAPPKDEEVEALNYNLQMSMPQAYTPVTRPDDQRCFAVQWPLDKFAYVTAVKVTPDQRAEVHHVIVNIIEPKDTGPYLVANGQDGRPGWHCGLSGGLAGSPLPRQIGGWVPGAVSGAAPAGTGLGVEPGSLMVVQMHYNTLVAEPTPDQTTIQVATSDTVDRPASGFLFTNPAFLLPGGMPIAAGDPDARHKCELPARLLALVFGAPAKIKSTDSWAIHTGFLHMHTLAKTGRLTLIRADGTEQVIVDIRDWDFNWQSTYRLEREVLINPNDRFRLECSWDNSAANQAIVNGVQNTPKYMEWGEGTGDEMCLTSFYMTRPQADYDYSYAASMHIEAPAYRQRFAPGDLVPLALLFNNFTLQEPGDASADSGQADAHEGVYNGHYNVYLDTDDDAAEHLTAWDTKFFYQLPENLPVGPHTLRVSLRGADHHALGIEESVEIEVADNPVVQPVQLIDANDWAMQSAADDSYSAHRPADVNCPDNSWYNEDGALEVQTGYCNYLSLAQPAKVAVAKGNSLHLVLWHGSLAYAAPAEGHVAITIDGHTVWEQSVKIPAEANIYDVRIPIDFDAPAGSKVEYHLHNHGYNTWTLLQLDVER